MRYFSIPIILSALVISNCIIILPIKKSDPEPSLYWCPPLPNCASTESITPYLHKIDSFELLMSPEQAWPIVLQTVKEMERTEITTQHQGYIHAKAHSRVFHFIDYFEVLMIPAEKRIAVRSSAMLGITDFWVNYRRAYHFRDVLIARGVIKE